MSSLVDRGKLHEELMLRRGRSRGCSKYPGCPPLSIQTDGQEFTSTELAARKMSAIILASTRSDEHPRLIGNALRRLGRDRGPLGEALCRDRSLLRYAHFGRPGRKLFEQPKRFGSPHGFERFHRSNLADRFG